MSDTHIQKINIDDKEIILIGTAHVSKDSALEVSQFIENEMPDSICIELDKERYASLNNPKKWEDTNIIDIIRKNQAFLFLANTILGAYQRKMATKFNSEVGKEMSEAIRLSKEHNINLVLADRNIQTTFKRIWRKHSLANKAKIVATLLASDDTEDINEEDIQKLMSGDMLEDALKDVSKEFPVVYEVLVEERNKYLAYNIRHAQGQKIIAVVGAAHIPGITEEISNNIEDISEFDVIPEKTIKDKLASLVIPAILIGMIIFSFTRGKDIGMTQIKSWVLIHSILSGIGATLCLANPLSIITAMISAPITSLYPLNPLFTAGVFTGIVEALIKKPKVSDFQNIYDDCSSFKGIIRNRVTKILLIVLIVNLFSSISSFICGFDIIKNLFTL